MHSTLEFSATQISSSDTSPHSPLSQRHRAKNFRRADGAIHIASQHLRAASQSTLGTVAARRLLQISSALEALRTPLLNIGVAMELRSEAQSRRESSAGAS
jgi:hypothetical protein